MEIRALTPAEQKYTYAQSMQLEGQTSNIGHLRGDFASSGYGFYTIIPKAHLQEAIAPSTVSVWIRKNTPFCFGAIRLRAITIFTAIAL